MFKEGLIVRDDEYGVGYIQSICCGGNKIIVKFIPKGVIQYANGRVAYDKKVQHKITIIGRVTKFKNV